MKVSQFKIIAITITVAILISVGVQSYWSLAAFTDNRQQLISELHTVTYASIQAYYTGNSFNNIIIMDGKRKSDAASLPAENNKDQQVQQMRGVQFSMRTPGSRSNDSTNRKDRYEQLLQQVFNSLGLDTLDEQKLDRLFAANLAQRNLTLNYKLSILSGHAYDSSAFTLIHTHPLLPHQQKIGVKVSNLNAEIFRRSKLGIGLSVGVSLVIIGALVFLYRVIKNQKELAIVKNDLINNITHEFKTPIATALTALEGVQYFSQDEQQKDRYLRASVTQLNKLTTMVEKVLETASLDHDKLLLKKETTSLNNMLRQVMSRYEEYQNRISITMPEQEVLLEVDPFHLENAISNLLDNALKYGGEAVTLGLEPTGKAVQVSVTDNGGNIPRAQADKIFEKFYRVPSGNIHDVKGFGIGLYYTRTIVEKHGGRLTLVTGTQLTRFTIHLP